MLDYYHFKAINELYLTGRHEEARLQLMEMQARYIAVCDENSMLKAQVQEMEDILFLAKNLIFDGYCYWLMTGTLKQGPFCSACYNREGALVRLESIDDEWRCTMCGTRHEKMFKPAVADSVRRAPQLAKIVPFSG